MLNLEYTTYHVVFNQLLKLEHTLLACEHSGLRPGLEGCFTGIYRSMHLCLCRLWHPGNHFICGLEIIKRHYMTAQWLVELYPQSKACCTCCMECTLIMCSLAQISISEIFCSCSDMCCHATSDILLVILTNNGI